MKEIVGQLMSLSTMSFSTWNLVFNVKWLLHEWHLNILNVYFK